MDINIDFNTGHFANDMLRRLGNYITDHAQDGNNGALSKAIADGRVRVSNGSVEQTGKNGWFLRSRADKDINDEMRRTFLEALKSELGMEETQDRLLDHLERLFGRDVFKREAYGGGHPLTMRRITLMLNRIDDVKAQLKLERMQVAVERLESTADDVRELMRECRPAKGESGVGRYAAVMRQVEDFLEKSNMAWATKLDLPLLCYKALVASGKGQPVTSAQVEELTKFMRERLGAERLERFETLARTIADETAVCLDNRAQFHGDNFSQRFTRAEAEALIVRFRASVGGDEATLRKYALMSLEIDWEMQRQEVPPDRQFEYTCDRLREYGVSDEVAKNIWNVDNLNTLETKVGQPRGVSQLDVAELVDRQIQPALAYFLGEGSAEAVAALAGRLKADCPKFGTELRHYAERMNATAEALKNLGSSLMRLVDVRHPGLSAEKKFAVCAVMCAEVRARIVQQAKDGTLDMAKAVLGLKVPDVETLRPASTADQMLVFKTMLLKYREEFSALGGNANNNRLFNSHAGSKLNAILHTLEKVVAMKRVEADVTAKFQAALVEAGGRRGRPCNKTAAGRQAVEIIETVMGAGAHGNINGIGAVAYAVEMFCKVPELVQKAVIEDLKNGDDKCIRQLCDALNTDGCVEAYCEPIAALSARFDGIVIDDVDLGDKNSDVGVLLGRAHAQVLRGIDEEHPVSFDDFAKRFARYLADRDYGAYEDRLGEIRAAKESLMYVVGDFGVLDDAENPPVSKTTLFNLCFAEPGKTEGEVVQGGGEYEWKGIVFRADSRTFREVREDGRKAAQPVDGFSSRNDLSVEENLNEAKGVGPALAATGQSGVSCCRTIGQCVGYASMSQGVVTDTFIYVIDTRKLAPGEKAWDMDSVYVAGGGQDPGKAGAEVNASSVRREAVMGWIKVPSWIANLDHADGNLTLEETKLRQLKRHLESHPGAIELNATYLG